MAAPGVGRVAQVLDLQGDRPGDVSYGQNPGEQPSSAVPVVLLELNAAPGRKLRMSELGQRAVLSRTRVSRVVDELVAAGLTERQPDEADGRSSFAVLTAAGQQALRKAWPVYREAIHQRLGARLTPEQCRELAALLDLAVAESDIALPDKPSR